MTDVIINWMGDPENEGYFHFHIGGMDNPTDEFVYWDAPSIGIGSEILIRVLDATTVDPPHERKRYEPPPRSDYYRQILHECNSELTPDECRLLIQEMVAELEAIDRGEVIRDKRPPAE